METGISDLQQFVLLIIAILLFAILIPIFVGGTRKPGFLQGCAVLLCVLSLPPFFGAFLGLGLSGLLLLPFAAGLWFAALFCGLAAATIRALDHNARESTRKLLTGSEELRDPRLR